MKFTQKEFNRDIEALNLIVIKIKKYFNCILRVGELIAGLENLLNHLTTVEEE